MALVRLFASLRKVVGQKELVIPADSVRELVEKFTESYEKISPLLLESANPLKLKPYNIILVNGRDIRSLHGVQTRLKNEDVVSMFPPVGGG